MKIYELSVKKPVSVVMAVLMFFVIGLYSLSMLSIEMMPDMSIPVALVMTRYSNVAPDEIENLVTKNIESAISGVSGVDTMTSQSSEGMSITVIQFTNSTDIDQAVDDLSQRIDMISMLLPDGVEDPMIMKMDSSAMPVVQMSFGVEGYDTSQTKKYVDDTIENKLESVEGVASVSVSGAQDREIHVKIDPDKLYGYDLSISQLAAALAAGNTNQPGGNVKGNGRDMAVRAMGKIESLEEMKNIPMTTTKGQVVYISDVADIEDTYSERSTYARLNGENSLSINITKQSDANTVDVVNGVKKTLEQLKASNPNITYNITMEQASYIENAINSVAENAVTGAILAIIILLLFLGSMRSSLVIGVAMPVSVITTFIGMYFSGMTLNVVSLGGLALGVGMLVDNAVVVLENIFRHRTALKKDGETAAIEGTAEVVGAIVASVLTTCIVYVPILFIDNMMAVMFKQLAFTIIFSQVASLIVTFLLVPMLSSKIKDIENTGKGKLGFLLKPFDKLMNKFYMLYEKGLRICLNHRKMLVTVILALFVVSLGVLSIIGMELMPSSDEGSFTITIETPQGTELDTTNDIVLGIEDIVKQNENVQDIFATVGSSNALGTSSSNSGSITLTLIDKEERKGSTQDIMEDIRAQLADIAGAEITMAATSSTGMTSTSGLSFNFTGDDTETLEEYVNDAAEILASIDGVTEVSTSVSDTKSEVRVRVNKNRAQHYGLTVASAASLIKSSIDGQTATQYSENGKEYDVIVKYPDDYMDDYTDLQNLRLRTNSGQWITLNDIADVTIERGYSSLTRTDQKRTITLSGNIYGSDMGTINQEFTEKLAQLPVPEGCAMEATGSFETMMESMMSLLTAIILGIILMYMVMAAQFGNLKQPLIILGTVPMAMIGVVLALVLDSSPLSVIGCIGILMLVGMVVNNAIVLIEFINDLKREGFEGSQTELLVEAGKTRLRPILMTTLTTILGFLPMVLSTSEGSEMMRPLAVVLTGGLSMGTLLTLFVIPVIYSLTDRKKKPKKERKLAKHAAN